MGKSAQSGEKIRDVRLSVMNPAFDPAPEEDIQDKMEKTEYKLYKRRWYVLIVIILLNISNAMLWINLAPIATIADSYYDFKGGADIFSLTFMVVSIPVMFVAMWGVDSFGVRTGVWLGSVLNFLGALLRLVASIHGVPTSARFPVAILGQVVAALAQPFIMFLPTKLAGLWFPQSQRAIANTLGSMSNPLGILIAYRSSPAIVTSQDHMLLLNGVTLGPALGALVLGLGGVWRSVPPTPPTASAAEESLPFWPGFKAALRTKSFLVLMLVLGGGVGLFNSIYTLTQQIVCVKGYDNNMAGNCGALLIGGGLVGAGLTGVFVDITHLFQETAKVCYGLAACFCCALSVVLLMPEETSALYALFFFFGMCGFAMYPIGLEMGVEITYPVAEATSSGLILISGQVLGVVFLLVMQTLASILPVSDDDQLRQLCTRSAPDAQLLNFRPATIFWAVVTCGLALVMILGFWPRYKRMEAEAESRRALPSPSPDAPSPAPTDNIVVHM